MKFVIPFEMAYNNPAWSLSYTAISSNRRESRALQVFTELSICPIRAKNFNHFISS